MEEDLKGSVASLASLFPVEEAEKAIRRVEEAIAEKQKTLDHLHHFSSENTNLLKLVQRLPDELFHDAMVPFGKAAFFPGRLLHTNEFLVLLGEGYYAERTSKQAVEILQRRGKVLESQINSVKAMMLDLKAEASFFDTTAAEAAEGLVEIREDYIEELPSKPTSNQADLPKSNLGSPEGNDEEYAKIMARLDELEREELAADNANDDDDDDEDEANIAADYGHAKIMARLDELEREELAAENANDDGDADEDNVAADYGCSESKRYIDDTLKFSEDNGPRHLQKQLQTKSLDDITANGPLHSGHSQPNYSNQSINSKMQVEDLKTQHMPKDESWNGKNGKFNSNEKIHVASSSNIESHGSTTSEGNAGSQKVATNTAPASSERLKAFTGSVIEHTDNLQTKSASSQSTSPKPSKPVSRFRMQKGCR